MSLADLVARVVDQAPPLTARQLAAIAVLLRPARSAA
jgi:hypothetical protein